MRTRYLSRTTILLLLVCSALLLWKLSIEVHQTSSSETVHAIKDADFLGEILQRAFDRVKGDLKVADELEQGLLLRAMKGKTTGSPMTVTIVLIIPNENEERCEKYESRNDEQSFAIKMTKLRTTKAVEPVGIISTAAIAEGKLFTDHVVLEYRSDGQWHESPLFNLTE